MDVSAKNEEKLSQISVLSNFPLSLTRLSFGGAGVNVGWPVGCSDHPGRHWAPSPSHLKAAAAGPYWESSPAVKPGGSQILASQRQRATNSTAASQCSSLEYHIDIRYQPRYQHVCL
jgi:hypothetical protein